MSCLYNYKNKQYTRKELLDLIVTGQVLPGTIDKVAARQEIQRITGMDAEEISFVKGLIDNGSIGRLLSDGKILLSDMATESTVYHEAFHRIWQGALSQNERSAAKKEFLSKKNWEALVAPYREQYGNDIDTLIEEKFADDFSAFVLSEKKPKSFLDKLFDKIKKFLQTIGLLNRSEIERLYDVINRGGYASKSVSLYYKQSDKIVLPLGLNSSIEIASSVYTSIIEAYHIEVMKNIIKAGYLDNYLNNTGLTFKINSNMVVNNVLLDIIESDEEVERLWQLHEDGEITVDDIENSPARDKFYMIMALNQDLEKKDSQILGMYTKYIAALNGKFKTSSDKENALSSEEEIEGVETPEGEEEVFTQDNVGAGDGAFFDRINVEFDPNATMSTNVKVLLSSLVNPFDKTAIGTNRSYNWVAFATFLNNNLAGTEATDKAMFDKLEELKKHPYYGEGIEQLIELLGGKDYVVPKTIDQKTNDRVNLRVKFISHFAKSYYNYVLTKFTKENIYPFDINKDATESMIRRAISSKFIAKLSSFPDSEAFIEKLASLQSQREVLEFFDLKNEGEAAIAAGHQIDFMSNIMSIRKQLLSRSKVKENLAVLSEAFSERKSPYDINGFVSKIVNFIAETNKVSELSMFNSENKKIYAVSTGSYITQVFDDITAFAKENKKLSPQELKAKFFQYFPQYDTVQGRNSKWLEWMFENPGKFDLIVNEGIRSDNSDVKAPLSDINESTLLSVYINQLLERNISPIWQTVKHSDRSTLYGIRMKKNLDFEMPEEQNHKDRIKVIFKKYLVNEVEKFMMMEKGDGKDIQYLSSAKWKDSLFGERTMTDGQKAFIVTDAMYEKLKENFGNQSDVVWETAMDRVTDAILDNAKADHEYIKSWNVYDEMDYGGENYSDVRPIGISKEVFKYYENLAKIKYPNLDPKSEALRERAYMLISMDYSINSLIGYIEQSYIITGDPNLYKNSADSFKRFNVWSSTGDLAVHGEMVNDYILETEKNLVAKIDGKEVIYGETKYATDPNLISSQTYAEEEYPIDEETLDNYEKRSYASMYELATALGKTNAEAEKMATVHSKKLRAAYETANEPDGQSWINLFEWRRTKIRWGQWTNGHQRLFEKELEILNGNEAAYEIPTGEDAAVYMNEFLGLAETIKGQYAGPYWSNHYRNQNLNVQGVAKTSFYPLLPSQIRGTQLEKLNKHLIKNGMGVVHVGSARKVGQRLVLDDKMQPLNNENYIKGLPKAYGTDGNINLDVDYEKAMQYMESKYFKHQVKIHNYEKGQVTSSSQSFKLSLSNLYSEGKPLTPQVEELVKKYVDLVTSRIVRSIDELEKDMGYDKANEKWDDMSKLIRILKGAVAARGGTKNMLDALDVFEKAEHQVIELLSNRSKIEPVMYALVKNNVLNQKRTGNAVPQVTALWWNSESRKTVNGGVYASNDLKMYEGDKNYSEVMLPLPTKWIEPLFEAYGTRNLVELIDMVNRDIANGKYDKINERMLYIKGLRIPNQQLSSNDTFRIKKFLVPSNTAMVVVPASIVVKVGSDFDIDKLTMYYPNGKIKDGKFVYLDKETSTSPKERTRVEENELLQVEIDIMSLPINFMNLMKPTDDKQWKVESRGMLESIGKEKDRPELITKKLSTFDVYTARTNVEKTRENIGSKGGVGQVAVNITNNTINQLSGAMRLLTEEDTPFPLFRKDTGQFSIILNEEDEFISELLSGLLTSQVDAVKDPYAISLGLTNQTLNMATYLLQRGAAHKDIVLFFAQPIIRDYIKNASVYESVIYSESGKVWKMRNDLITKYEEKIKGIEKMSLPEILARVKYLDYRKEFLSSNYDTFKRQMTKMEPEAQLAFLDLFKRIMTDTKEHRAYIRTRGLDTFKPKSLGEVLQRELDFVRVAEEKYFGEQLGEGGVDLISGFSKVMNGYFEWFSKMYMYKTKGGLFEGTENSLNEYLKSDEKISLMKKLPEEFANYVIQNYHPLFKKYSFEDVSTGTNSVPRQIMDRKKFGENYRIYDALVPQLQYAETTFGIKSDVVRLADQGDNMFQIEEYINEMEEIYENDPEFYEQLVAYTVYTYGLSNSILSLERVIPANNPLSKFNMFQTTGYPRMNAKESDDFIRKFALINKKFLPRYSKQLEKKLLDSLKEEDSYKRIFAVSGRGKDTRVVELTATLGRVTTKYFKPLGGFGYGVYNKSVRTSNGEVYVQKNIVEEPVTELVEEPMIEAPVKSDLKPNIVEPSTTVKTINLKPGDEVIMNTTHNSAKVILKTFIQKENIVELSFVNSYNIQVGYRGKVVNGKLYPTEKFNSRKGWERMSTATYIDFELDKAPIVIENDTEPKNPFEEGKEEALNPCK
jgi:hypothetical protein